MIGGYGSRPGGRVEISERSVPFHYCNHMCSSPILNVYFLTSKQASKHEDEILIMMVKVMKASSPSIPPRRKSLSWDGSSHSSFTFPRSYHLVITTAKGVFVWGSHGVSKIFRSGSEGIVAAKKTSSDNSLLAVADSQVVVLHDVNKGMQRSYRLKGSDVCASCSVEHYTDTNDSRVKYAYLGMPATRRLYFLLPLFRTLCNRTP